MVKDTYGGSKAIVKDGNLVDGDSCGVEHCDGDHCGRNDSEENLDDDDDDDEIDTSSGGDEDTDEWITLLSLEMIIV